MIRLSNNLSPFHGNICIRQDLARSHGKYVMKTLLMSDPAPVVPLKLFELSAIYGPLFPILQKSNSISSLVDTLLAVTRNQKAVTILCLHEASTVLLPQNDCFDLENIAIVCRVLLQYYTLKKLITYQTFSYVG